MLCFTNGDIVVDGLRRGGLSGEIVSWKDVLHDGPVPSHLSFEELREVRARFISERGWGGFDGVMGDFERRDATLAGFGDHEEVVLCFEHDLYDQLQLIQLLDWFAQRNLGRTRLSLVQTDEYLGNLPPGRLCVLFEERHRISGRQLDLGSAAWAAFRAPEPARISALLRQDTSALPFLGDALLRHLQQFPSVKNGLSRSESQALEEIQKRPKPLREVYVASHQEREDVIFLGDSVFAWYLERLGDVREPLVLFEDGDRIEAPRTPDDEPEFWDRHVKITENGRAVLEGVEDHVELNGIDRWLGGVHLSGEEARWRWDGATGRMTEGAI